MDTGINVLKKSKSAISFTESTCPICGDNLELVRKYTYYNKNTVTVKVMYTCKCGFTCPIKYSSINPEDYNPIYFNEIQEFMKSFGNDD